MSIADENNYHFEQFAYSLFISRRFKWLYPSVPQVIHRESINNLLPACKLLVIDHNESVIIFRGDW